MSKCIEFLHLANNIKVYNAKSLEFETVSTAKKGGRDGRRVVLCKWGVGKKNI